MRFYGYLPTIFKSSGLYRSIALLKMIRDVRRTLQR